MKIWKGILCGLLLLLCSCSGSDSNSVSGPSGSINQQSYATAKSAVIRKLITIAGAEWTAGDFKGTTLNTLSPDVHTLNCGSLPKASIELSFITNATANSVQSFNWYFGSQDILYIPSSAFTVSNDTLTINLTISNSSDTLIRYAVLYFYTDLMSSENNMINANSDASVASQALTYLEEFSNTLTNQDGIFDAAYTNIVNYYTAHLNHFASAAAQIELYIDREFWVSNGKDTAGFMGLMGDCSVTIGDLM